MKKLLWDIYTGADFQTFCNNLLAFEISKKYIPFNAPGKDGGYDGKFVGEYDGRSGLWRFQCKFHNTARATAFKSLKSDVDSELKKISGEDNLILLTNFDVSPKERGEIFEKINNYNLQHNSKPIFFDLWDNSKLSAIVLRHPIVRTWLDEKSSTWQLRPFKKEMYEVFQEINFFAGRDDQLKSLRAFLESDNSLLSITGEAGIGKTRLCSEFFDTLNDNDQWHVLSLDAYSIDFDKINLALTGERNYIVYIDDAHRYPAELIADFYNLSTTNRVNKIKVILTARSVFTEYLKLIKEFDQLSIPQIRLNPIIPDEAKVIFEKSLKNTFLTDHIGELISISRGRPILMAAIINAANNNVKIIDIKSQDFLKTYVQNHFESLVEAVSIITGEHKIKIRSLLFAVCLIEPISYNDDAVKQLLADTEHISLDIVDTFFIKLVEHGYATPGREISIKPDYYSDIFLSTADNNWVLRRTKSYEKFIYNIIENLVAVEESANDATAPSANILESFILRINSPSSLWELNELFKTVDYISYQRPRFAVEAIEALLAVANNRQHHMSEALRADLKTESTKQYGYYSEIKSILYNLSYHEDFFQSSIELAIKLYHLTNDKTIFNRFVGFTKRDAVNQFQCKFQRYFIDYVSPLLSDEHSSLVEPIINSFKDLLRLSFTTSSSDFINRLKIHIVTYFIRERKEILTLRLNIIDKLCSFYLTTNSKANKHLVLDLILDVPREISATTREKVVYNGKQEVTKIIAFLFDITKNGIEIDFQQKILERIYWYRKWKVTSDIFDELDLIEQNLAPQTLSEKLIKLFSKSSEDIDLDFDQIEKNFKTEANRIIENSEVNNLFNALSEINKSYQRQLPYYYSSFLTQIFEYPDKTEQIFTEALVNDKNFTVQWGCVMLKALRFKHGRNDFFWKNVEEILAWDSIEAYNCVLFIYNYITDNEIFAQLNEQDALLIEQIYHKNLPDTFHYLSYSLPCILQINPDKGQILIGQFLDRCNQTHADNLIFFLINYYKHKFQHIEYLVLAHTIRFEITYYIEKALQWVLDNNWETQRFSKLFKYLIRRYEECLIVRKDRLSNYHPVRMGDKSELLANRSIAEKNHIFQDLLTWYTSVSHDYHEMLVGQDLLEYLRPSDYVTPELRDIYKVLLLKNIDNVQNIYKLSFSLEIFHRKTTEMVEILVLILSFAENNSTIIPDLYDDIYSSCYSALTTIGIKTGTPGQPFEVDVELHRFILEQIALYPTNHKLQRLLNDVRKRLERDINDEKFRDHEEW